MQRSQCFWQKWCCYRGLRPEIPPFVPEKLSLLAQQCWHQDPKQRPEFSEVLLLVLCLTCHFVAFPSSSYLDGVQMPSLYTAIFWMLEIHTAWMHWLCRWLQYWRRWWWWGHLTGGSYLAGGRQGQPFCMHNILIFTLAHTVCIEVPLTPNSV